MVEGPAGSQVFTVVFWSVLGLVLGIVAGTLVVSSFYGDRVSLLTQQLQVASDQVELNQSKALAAEQKLSVLQAEADRLRQSADGMGADLAAARSRTVELESQLSVLQKQAGATSGSDEEGQAVLRKERDEARRQLVESRKEMDRLGLEHEKLQKLHVQLKRLYLELKKDQTGLGSVPLIEQP